MLWRAVALSHWSGGPIGFTTTCGEVTNDSQLPGHRMQLRRPNSRRNATVWLLVCGCAFVTAVTVATSNGDQAATPTPSAPAAAPAVPPAPAQSGYAGSDTCLLCHSDMDATLKGTKHAQALDPRTPAAQQNCESCHGPGQAHVDDDEKGHILKFAKASPAESSGACLNCHSNGAHAGWQGSRHEERNLTCTTCHSVHHPVSAAKQLVKSTETQLCATCHRTQVAKTERAVAHMPVREGKMSCTSCHNPHGSVSNVKALRTGSSVAESCTTCHTEMRGPVLWEHTPVRENCATCHDPHGSSNDRMLAVRQPMLCQRCHVATKHPSSIYDNDEITVKKSNRMFGRSCVNCHSNVHGSNHPSGQFFMR
jgi:DmsE family decaheme c-type cytochrome